MDYSLTLIPTISQQVSSSAGPIAMPSELHIDAKDIMIVPGNDRKGAQAKVYMGLAKTPEGGTHSQTVAVKESTNKDPTKGKKRFKKERNPL